MNKKKNFIFIFFLFFLNNCSLDNKTGIWNSEEKAKSLAAEIEKKQKSVLNTDNIFISEKTYAKEKILKKNINLPSPKRNQSWIMSGLNHQNNLGNVYLSSADNLFLKKKISKNKFSIFNVSTSPLIYKNNIFLTDDAGTIFKTDIDGRIIWKVNIYKKIYKKIYKHISFTLQGSNIYISDNIGFIYSIDINTGKVLWIKNHGVPLKSKIKIFKNHIFLINQDNRILALSINNGSVIWDIRSISSFIKTQSLLSVAISKKGDVVISNSSGDLIKANSLNGDISWALNSLGNMLDETDFFKSSDIVIENDSIYFSTKSSLFSYRLDTGFTNWEVNVNSVSAPVISGKKIFTVSDSGFFIILNSEDGKIISSTNILKILKMKKQSTKISGFVMGSGKIYSVTLNGYLIISSASTGKVESFKKIGNFISTNPIIYDGKLFIYVDDSKILGFK